MNSYNLQPRGWNWYYIKGNNPSTWRTNITQVFVNSRGAGHLIEVKNLVFRG